MKRTMETQGCGNGTERDMKKTKNAKTQRKATNASRLGVRGIRNPKFTPKIIKMIKICSILPQKSPKTALLMKMNKIDNLALFQSKQEQIATHFHSKLGANLAYSARRLRSRKKLISRRLFEFGAIFRFVFSFPSFSFNFALCHALRWICALFLIEVGQNSVKKRLKTNRGQTNLDQPIHGR